MTDPFEGADREDEEFRYALDEHRERMGRPPYGHKRHSRYYVMEEEDELAEDEEQPPLTEEDYEWHRKNERL